MPSELSVRSNITINLTVGFALLSRRRLSWALGFTSTADRWITHD
jgi:hypothetical protein